MFSNVRIILFICFLILINGCGRPQRGTASALNMGSFEELVQVGLNNKSFAYLTSDYKYTTEVNFSKTTKSYLLEGGNYDAVIIEGELWVFDRDDRGTILRFSSNGELIGKLPSVEGGGVQSVENYRGQKLLTKKYDCQLFALNGVSSGIDFSQYSETKNYCQEVEMKNGTEANKIFGLFHWQGKDYATTYQTIFSLKEIGGHVNIGDKPLELNFGNPYSKVKTWPNENGFLISAQSGSYVGSFKSGIEIWNDPEEKLQSFNIQELLGRPSARVLDVAIGKGGALFVLVNEWEGGAEPKSTVVEIQWMGQHYWRVLSEFDGLSMAIELTNENQLILSTDLGLRWINLSETKIVEKLINTDAQGKIIQNPSRLFIF